MKSPVPPMETMLQMLSEGEGWVRELVERASKATHGKLRINPGAAAVGLRQLVRYGMAESWPERGPHQAGVPRTCYRITPEGDRIARDVRLMIAGLYGLIPATQDDRREFAALVAQSIESKRRDSGI